MSNLPPSYLFAALVVIIFALSFHEFAHAKLADLAGDDTPRLMGRVSLNPLRHLDPLGTIMIIVSSLAGVGIGWGKPVMVRPERMKNPRWDQFISVAGGPLSNLLQAIVYAIAMRLLTSNGTAFMVVTERGGLIPGNLLTAFLFFGVLINCSLCLFNLIPLGPLDGHWLVGAFMPDPMRLAWYRFNRGFGQIIFIILILIPSSSPYDLLGRFYYPFVMKLAAYLFGFH